MTRPQPTMINRKTNDHRCLSSAGYCPFRLVHRLGCLSRSGLANAGEEDAKVRWFCSPGMRDTTSEASSICHRASIAGIFGWLVLNYISPLVRTTADGNYENRANRAPHARIMLAFGVEFPRASTTRPRGKRKRHR